MSVVHGLDRVEQQLVHTYAYCTCGDVAIRATRRAALAALEGHLERREARGEGVDYDALA